MRKGMIFFIAIFLIISIGIGVFSILNKDTEEWRIDVLDLPSIVEYNPVTMQTELESPRILEENEIRIAAFQICNPKGKLVRNHIAQLWQKKGILQGASMGLEGRNIWFRFNENRIEAWTSADKFFTAEGQVIISLVDIDNEQVIISARANVNVSHLPIKVEDIFP